MDGHCLSPYTCKRCIVLEQFDGLNFDGLAGKHQKRQNFPRQNFALCGSVVHNVNRGFLEEANRELSLKILC